MCFANVKKVFANKDTPKMSVLDLWDFESKVESKKRENANLDVEKTMSTQ